MIDFRNPDGKKFMDARAAAFEAIFKRLKNDTVLSRVVRKWSFVPLENPQPTANDLPFIQITLPDASIGVASPNTHETGLAIDIKYAVSAAGADEETAWIDLINLYSHIEKAIDPFGDIAWLRSAVSAVDSTAVIRGPVAFVKPGITSIPLSTVNAVAGVCRLSVPIKTDTCRSK